MDDRARTTRKRVADVVSGAIPNSVLRWAASRGAPVARLSGHTSLGSAALAQALTTLATPPKRLWSRTGRGSVADVADRIGRSVEEVQRWQNAGMLRVGGVDAGESLDRASFDRAALIDLALRSGADERDLAAAAAGDNLVWAALESVVTSRGPLNGAQAAESAGFGMGSLRVIWQALGLPTGGLEQAAFTRRDVHALRTLGALRALFSEDDIAEAASVLGRAMADVSSVMTDLFRRRLADPLLAAGGTDVDVVVRLVVMRDLLMPTLAPLVEITLERHIEAAIRAEIGVRMEAMLDPGTGHRVLSVGFADLVGFTSVSEERSPSEVRTIASRLLRLAEPAVGLAGGRIVKSIGDAVMYTTSSPVAAATAGVELVEAVRADDSLPPVRVGIAHGPVLPGYADYFGRTVNLASRLCAVAEAGQVIVAAAAGAADQAAWGAAGLRVTAHTLPPLKGIEGDVDAVTVGRA